MVSIVAILKLGVITIPIIFARMVKAVPPVPIIFVVPAHAGGTQLMLPTIHSIQHYSTFGSAQDLSLWDVCTARASSGKLATCSSVRMETM